MADNVKVETGNGTQERVAYDLTVYIRNQVDQDSTFRTKDQFLDLYAECLIATSGGRKTSMSDVD